MRVRFEEDVRFVIAMFKKNCPGRKPCRRFVAIYLPL